MRISEDLIELIKKLEGFKADAYLCPGGYKTIGFGHVINKVSDLTHVNYDMAEELLHKDLKKAEDSVQRNIKINLNQGQFDALVSFTFNLGAASLQRSALRQKVNREEHDEVPREFMRWIYAGGIALPGLIKRRGLEAEMYSS